MISIKRNFEEIPHQLRSDNCFEKIKICISEKNNHKFSTHYYREGCLSLLKSIYHNKCAFCETDTSAGASLRVDHYRPKANLREDDGHLGYYWLGYEWTNLILLCEKCNRFKSNHFPISVNGIRVYHPILDEFDRPLIQTHVLDAEHFLSENALLLNPEINDVENHFIITSEGFWKPLTEEGKATERICNLNRFELKRHRKSKIDKLVSNIKRELVKFIEKRIDEYHFKENLKKFFEDLEKKTASNNIYSRTYWFMFYKFEQIILPHFEGHISRTVVMDAFKEFLKGNL
jgi:hypothetical protein